MRRRLTLLVAAMLAVSVIAAAPAGAEGHDDDGGTLLSLGDSVAAGTQSPAPFTDNGYADRLFQDLKDGYGFDKLVNLACPNDDTVEMRLGIGGGSMFGSWCYGPFSFLPPGGSSQLDVAVDYLTANPGEVRLITIAIGANDLLTCDPEDPPEIVQACVAAQLGQIAANLPIIIGTLQAVAPGVPIVAMNYYQPNVALWLVNPDLAALSLAVTGPFNATLEAVYGAFGVPVADVDTAFKTFKDNGKVPQNVRAACLWTRMCEKQGPNYVLSDWDPHERGHRRESASPGSQTGARPQSGNSPLSTD